MSTPDARPLTSCADCGAAIVRATTSQGEIVLLDIVSSFHTYQLLLPDGEPLLCMARPTGTYLTHDLLCPGKSTQS